MRRLRVTKFAVLLNTNVTAHNGGVVVELLEDYLKNELWVPSTMVSLLPTRSGDPSHILQVDVQAPSIEIGPKQGRVHAHFIVKVRHCDSVMIAPVQGLMQRHVRANSVFYAAYVSVTLMDAKAENYALKEAFI